jgi:hypothetical protein
MITDSQRRWFWCKTGEVLKKAEVLELVNEFSQLNPTQLGDLQTTTRAIHSILDDVDCLSEERAMWTTMNYFQLLKLSVPSLIPEVQELEDVLLGLQRRRRRQQPDGAEVNE